MILADISNGSRIHGGRTIFRNLSWSVQQGEKIGLIGPSGCGKSTLLRLFAGVDQPDSGTVTFRKGTRIAYLPQEYAGTPGLTALEELLASRADIAAIDHAIHAAERRIADPATLADPDAFDALLIEHGRLLDEFADAGGPMLRNRADGLLGELGFEKADRDLPMEALSGGQRKLVGIIRALLAEPELLLLDEPDNHLDLGRKAALEQIVRSFDGAVIVVSHDRYLLDETATTIIELEPNREDGVRLKRWDGNYTAYVAQRELALIRQQQDFASQQKEIARLEAAVAR
ncbi:MAG: ATP-binding cassette domain-containing protein, partial [Tepidiformaceae bacterium]